MCYKMSMYVKDWVEFGDKDDMNEVVAVVNCVHHICR